MRCPFFYTRTMVKIPAPNTSSTIYKVDNILEEEQRKEIAPFRGHLGASSIGKECERELWYSFRGATRVEHSGRILRLFSRGHEEEFRFVRYLRKAGVVVHDVDPRTGEQFNYSAFGGHFGGSMDGCAKGLVEAPKSWHVLEFKTSAEKAFNALKKNGVEKSKPEHFAQMQVYMKFSGMRRAYYLAVNKNNDELYSERIKFDSKVTEEYFEKARRIIESKNPPAKISEDPTWFKCRFCDHQKVCHQQEELSTLTCRTCLHATPVTEKENSTWSCALHDVDSLSTKQQASGCMGHRFIPSLVDYAETVDASEDKNYVEYALPSGERFRNGDLESGGFTSQDMKKHGSDVVKHRDDVKSILRKEFDGRCDDDLPRTPFEV